MKKLILLAVSAFILLSCDKDKCDEPKPKVDVTLLYDKKWKLSSSTLSIAPCDEDNVIEFKADKTFTRSFGTNKCYQGEPGTAVTTYHVYNDPQALIIEGVEYQIINLTSSSLDLQRDLGRIDSTDILIKYYYRPL